MWPKMCPSQVLPQRGQKFTDLDPPPPPTREINVQCTWFCIVKLELQNTNATGCSIPQYECINMNIKKGFVGEFTYVWS